MQHWKYQHSTGAKPAIYTAGLNTQALADETPAYAQLSLLQLDLDVHAGRQVELHQRVHGLVGRIHDVHQTLVGADFELVAARSC